MSTKITEMLKALTSDSVCMLYLVNKDKILFKVLTPDNVCMVYHVNKDKRNI